MSSWNERIEQDRIKNEADLKEREARAAQDKEQLELWRAGADAEHERVRGLLDNIGVPQELEKVAAEIWQGGDVSFFSDDKSKERERTHGYRLYAEFPTVKPIYDNGTITDAGGWGSSVSSTVSAQTRIGSEPSIGKSILEVKYTSIIYGRPYQSGASEPLPEKTYFSFSDLVEPFDTRTSRFPGYGVSTIVEPNYEWLLSSKIQDFLYKTCSTRLSLGLSIPQLQSFGRRRATNER